MSRVIKSLRNLELGARMEQLSSKPGKLEDAEQQQQGAESGGGGGKSGGLLSRLKSGKPKSYENLLDAGSPTEERPQQQQDGQSGWATFDDSANLIDLSSPLPPVPQPQVQPALFIEVSAPPPPTQPQQQPIIIRSDNGRHGGSLECLSVQAGGPQALFNPSFRKESPKAKAAPAPPSAAQRQAIRQTPPPRPSQPPPRPSQPPKVTTSASSNALLLLDLDFCQPPQQPPPQPPAKSRKAPAPPPPSQQRPFKLQSQSQPESSSSDSGHLVPGSVCSARFDLNNPPDPGILSLQCGDRLTIVRREDDNWMVARRLGGDYGEGLVACSYLAPAEDSPKPAPARAPAPTPKQTGASVTDSTAPASQARSLHEYRSDHPGDLSFAVGQLISEVRRVDSDWLEGQLGAGGPRGLFPANHVRLLLYPAVAAHAFLAQEAGDLALQVGDEVDVLAELPGGEWLRGIRRRRQGQSDDCASEEVGNFPAGFVAAREEAPASESAPSADQQRRARAIHDFAGRESDELSFRAGDVLTGLAKLGPDWMSGMAADGRRGMFPRAFVELL